MWEETLETLYMTGNFDIIYIHHRPCTWRFAFSSGPGQLWSNKLFHTYYRCIRQYFPVHSIHYFNHIAHSIYKISY